MNYHVSLVIESNQPLLDSLYKFREVAEPLLLPYHFLRMLIHQHHTHTTTFFPVEPPSLWSLPSFFPVFFSPLALVLVHKAGLLWIELGCSRWVKFSIFNLNVFAFLQLIFPPPGSLFPYKPRLPQLSLVWAILFCNIEKYHDKSSFFLCISNSFGAFRVLSLS